MKLIAASFGFPFGFLNLRRRVSDVNGHISLSLTFVDSTGLCRDIVFYPAVADIKEKSQTFMDITERLAVLLTTSTPFSPGSKPNMTSRELRKFRSTFSALL